MSGRGGSPASAWYSSTGLPPFVTLIFFPTRTASTTAGDDFCFESSATSSNGFVAPFGRSPRRKLIWLDESACTGNEFPSWSRSCEGGVLEGEGRTTSV